jgi:hypothetical protein
MGKNTGARPLIQRRATVSRARQRWQDHGWPVCESRGVLSPGWIQVPGLAQILRYERSWLRGDLLASLTVAASKVSRRERGRAYLP